jgi:transposase
MWIMAGNRERYSREFRERAVALVFEQVSEHASEWEAICAVASKLGVAGETLRKWVRQAEVDAGARPGSSSEESAELKRLRREVAELRRANETLQAASAFFARELCATRRRDNRGGVRDLSRQAVAAA